MPAKSRKQRESFGAVRKLPSGRVQASYVGPDGVRHTAPHTFAGLTDARAWLSTQRARIVEGKWQSADASRAGKSTATFGDYARRWLDTRTNRRGEALKPRTRSEYERLLSTCLEPLTPMRLNAITPDVVREWYTTLSASGAVTQAARAYGLLKSIMSTAVDDGRLALNPCKIRGAHTASTGKRVEPPTPEQLATIVDRISDRYKAAVLLAAWAGVRFGELTELRRKDLTIVRDAQRIVVTVSRGVTYVVGEGFIVGGTKSIAGMRSINLPPHVVPPILEHLDRYVGDSPDALLFPASDGVTHLAQSTLAKAFYPAREAAGRSDMPWHALRHYGATRAALAGATLKELQERLGHSTVKAAMAYQHATGRDEELARRMSDLANT